MNYLFPILAAVLWGGNTIVTKLSAAVLSPVEISFYRWVLAAIILTPFALGKAIQQRRTLQANLLKLITLGFLGAVVFQCLAYYAARYTTATNMGIIQSLVPVMALALALLFLSHRTTPGALLGIAISAAGVVVVVSHGDLRALVTHGLNVGDAMMLVSAFAFALYSFLVQKWKLKLPLLLSIYTQAVVASVALLPLFLSTDKHPLTTAGLAYIGFAGVAASIVAPVFWMHGIAKLGAARVTLYFNLVPVITAALATVMLSEKLHLSVLLGGGLAIVGVAMAELFQPKMPALDA